MQVRCAERFCSCFPWFLLQIETQKLEFKEKASSKVGSKDNIEHKAGGGDKQVKVILAPTCMQRNNLGKFLLSFIG